MFLSYAFQSLSLSQSPCGQRGAVGESAGVPESPRLELMEQDSKDSAQSISTSSSVEAQQEYSVSQGWLNFDW